MTKVENLKDAFGRELIFNPIAEFDFHNTLQEIGQLKTLPHKNLLHYHFVIFKT